MKKIPKILSVLLLLSPIGAGAANSPAQETREVKFIITDIRAAGGTMHLAVGDYSNPADMKTAMVQVTGDAVEIVLKDVPEGEGSIYVFHDTNGNFNLDMTAEGIPSEGCYMEKVKIGKDTGIINIGLKYYAGPYKK